jgi:hypothetical protein
MTPAPCSLYGLAAHGPFFTPKPGPLQLQLHPSAATHWGSCHANSDTQNVLSQRCVTRHGKERTGKEAYGKKELQVESGMCCACRQLTTKCSKPLSSAPSVAHQVIMLAASPLCNGIFAAGQDGNRNQPSFLTSFYSLFALHAASLLLHPFFLC